MLGAVVSRWLGCVHTQTQCGSTTSYMHTRDTHTGHSLHPTVQDSASAAVQYRPSCTVQAKLYSTGQAGSRWEWAAAVPCWDWDKLLSLYNAVHHCTPLHCTLLVDLSLGISVKILLALVTSANWEVENLLEFDLLVLESIVGMTLSHDSLLGNKIRKFLISLELNHRSWRNNKTSLRAQLTIEFILIVGQYLYTVLCTQWIVFIHHKAIERHN